MQAIKLLWERFYPTNHTERLATTLWLSKEIFVHNGKDLFKWLHLLSMPKIGRSGFQCNFIKYNVLKIKRTNILGNLDIKKRDGPNIPLLLSLVGNEKRLFTYL